MPKFGFIGLGETGREIVLKVIEAGQQVIVWDSEMEDSTEFEFLGAEIALSPRQLIERVDIVILWFEGTVENRGVSYFNEKVV